jgi:adenylate kinase family enzyme
VLVAGTSGAGKTTLGRGVGAELTVVRLTSPEDVDAWVRGSIRAVAPRR